MKILIVTLTVLFSLFSTKSFAEDVKVSNVILHSFQSSFETATEVKWSQSNAFFKADFNYNGQFVAAYYDVDGTLIAATRNITSFQLPISLQTSLKKDHQNLWISELFELNNDAGTTYYVTLENADTKLVLQSTGSTGWNTFQKQRKS